MPATVNDEDLQTALEDTIRVDRRGVPGATEAVPTVLERYRHLREQPALRALYEAGEPLHEVPFSVTLDGQIVRGTIDCLVRGADGSVRVLEFKTGRVREEHARQAELYRRAVAAVLPDSSITVDVVYASDHAEA
jgi:RecB family exonuclease